MCSYSSVNKQGAVRAESLCKWVPSSGPHCVPACMPCVQQATLPALVGLIEATRPLGFAHLVGRGPARHPRRPTGAARGASPVAASAVTLVGCDVCDTIQLWTSMWWLLR